MLTDRVIEEGTLLDDDDSISFDIRIPWYRSLPLSCVEGLDVTVDGTSVPAADDVRIAFDDTTYGLDELPPLYDDWWQVTDPARVTVPRAERVRVGAVRDRRHARTPDPLHRRGGPAARHARAVRQDPDAGSGVT